MWFDPRSKPKMERSGSRLPRVLIRSIARATGRQARAFDMAHSVWSKIIEDHAGVLWLAYGGEYGTRTGDSGP